VIAERYGCAIQYVLMTNHVYLMLTLKERNSASKLMQSLGRRYVHNRGLEAVQKRNGPQRQRRIFGCRR